MTLVTFQPLPFGPRGMLKTILGLVQQVSSAEAMLAGATATFSGGVVGLAGAAKASWVAGMAERPYDYTNPNSAARQRYANAYNTVASGGATVHVAGDLHVHTQATNADQMLNELAKHIEKVTPNTPARR